VANVGSHNIGVFLNSSSSGSLSFATQTTHTLYANSAGNGRSARWMAVGDVNNDGCKDIVAADTRNGATNETHMSVLLQNLSGSTCLGTFPAAATGMAVSTLNPPSGIALADFNGDGNLDAVVASYDNSGNGSFLTILNGTGTGSFSVANSISISNLSDLNNVFVAQVDSNTSYDIIVSAERLPTLASIAANSVNANFTVLLNNGSGTFTQQTSYTRYGSTVNQDSYAHGFAVGSVYGTSRPDILALQTNHFAVHQNTNGFNQENHQVVAYRNSGTGSFYAIKNMYSGLSSSLLYMNSAVAADFDGDNYSDVVAINYDAGTMSCMRSNAAGEIQNPVAYLSTGGGGNTSGNMHAAPPLAVVADFDVDGKPDLAVSNYSANNIGVLKNTSTSGSCTFGATSTYATTGSNPFGLTAYDINKDGYIDLAVATRGGNTIDIFYNNGDGTFASTPDVSVPVGGSTTPYSVAAGDVDNDGYVDLMTANSGTNTVSFFKRQSNGSYVFQTNLSVSQMPIHVLLADLRNNGTLDVITVNFNGTNVSVLLNNGSGSYGAASNYVVGTNPTQAIVTDFDQDGYLDLIVNLQFAKGFAYLRGNGDGTFQTAIKYSTHTDTSGLALNWAPGSFLPDFFFTSWSFGQLGRIFNFSN
jgi:hypothetical protein